MNVCKLLPINGLSVGEPLSLAIYCIAFLASLSW
jgi:hypothetical protein